MQIYAVIAPKFSPELDAAIKGGFPGNFFTIAPGQYLVAVYGLSPQEVGARVGDKGQVGSILILPFENYWGWHGQDMWAWVRARGQA